LVGAHGSLLWSIVLIRSRAVRTAPTALERFSAFRAPASSALAPDEINSNINNLSSRVLRANFDRRSDTTTPVIVRRPLEA
jgi:hypothetical protein